MPGLHDFHKPEVRRALQIRTSGDWPAGRPLVKAANIGFVCGIMEKNMETTTIGCIYISIFIEGSGCCRRC